LAHAAESRSREGLVRPREWVALLSGEDLAPLPHDAPSAIDVGVFRFPEMPERASLPPLDAHYVSFTIAGALVVERDLGRDVERAQFRPGLSLILPAGRENAWRWDGGTDELHLYISPAWLGEVAFTVGASSPVPVERFAFEDPLLRALTLALLDARRSGGIGQALFRDAAADTIALHFLRRHCDLELPASPAASLAPARLRRVRELIESDLGRDLSLDELATAAGLSRTHFARAFRNTTGQTPFAYVRERRTALARSLLATTSLPIAEIAALAGFSSHSHLGRVFRTTTGLTPSGYRRHMRS
jgi:AraC family transcriptional regulator